MAQCDGCLRWLHAMCDGIDEKKYELLSQMPDVPYYCPDCRGSNPTSQQSLDKQLQKKVVASANPDIRRSLQEVIQFAFSLLCGVYFQKPVPDTVRVLCYRCGVCFCFFFFLLLPF